MEFTLHHVLRELSGLQRHSVEHLQAVIVCHPRYDKADYQYTNTEAHAWTKDVCVLWLMQHAGWRP